MSTNSLPDFPDEVVTHARVQYIDLPHAAGTAALLTLDNGFDHRKPNTFVHEVEVGDLDGDGKPEVYATPSEPNRLDGTPQAGRVVRYVPKKKEGRVVVADLGSRHAKEILVADVDGDGRDELYVSVEAAEGGSVEIRRYDAEHAFANPSNPRYAEGPAADAWSHVLAFLSKLR